MDEKLVTLLKALQAARLGAEEAKARKNKILEEAQLSEAYQLAQADIGSLTNSAEIIGKEIEILCLPQFKADGNKHPHEAVTIKEFDVVAIANETAAREWCFTNFRPALKLDNKVFEKAATDGSVPAELATVTKEARVQVASDLSKYLA